MAMYVYHPIMKKKVKVWKDRQKIEQLRALNTNFAHLVKSKNTPLTINKLRDYVHHTVDDMTLLRIANLMIMLKIKPTKIPHLYRAAVKLGQALQLKPKKAIESLGRGLARQSRLVLDNIGIIFKMDEALRFYEQNHGEKAKSASETRDAWIEYAIHCILEQSKSLTLNQQLLVRHQYYAAVENARCGVIG